jgi:UDP-N-acetylglucosamine--N-acetylmuramyl-(pentapeptide) pyrophosphoryl-undecaprenol N-acetylglucosamine transferase
MLCVVMKKPKDRKKTIILTGGGTAGHIMPNLTLLPDLLSDGWDVHYIGGKNDIEYGLIPKDKLTYHEIRTGKLRRYFSLKNFSDPIRVAGGTIQSFAIISKVKPDVIFSKGGFVAVPVVAAGGSRGVPIIIHESDMTPGLANKLSIPFAKKVCVSFKQTLEYIPKDKGVYTGAPVRNELFDGDRESGFGLCGFDGRKPVLLVTGGSLGSKNVNCFVRAALEGVLNSFDVVHICGKGNAAETLEGVRGYKQFEFVTDRLKHLYKMADLAISRAGSGTIFEFLNLQIPSLLIPISKTASRGDQILNATEFEKAGYSFKLEEEEIHTPDVLIDMIMKTYNDRRRLIGNMKKDMLPDSKAEILSIIYSVCCQDQG